MNLENQSIPTGDSKEDIQKRKQFIMDLYKNWIIANPDKKIYNKSLQEDIYVRFLSIEETSQHAAKKYSSTKAVTHLTKILHNAVKKEVVEPNKAKKNQQRFEQIIKMEYTVNSEKINLIVGVLRGSKNNIQWGSSKILCLAKY
jgi:D-aminopeptidase